MTARAATPGLLVIRADAGATIGTGHVLRGLALAAAWQARGGGVLLVSHGLPAVLQRRVREANVDIVDPGARHPATGDLAATVRCARRRGAAALVLDGYFLDPGYQRGAGAAGCPVVVLDDHSHQPSYEADILLNQNLGAELISYRCNDGCRLLLGSRYTMLRPEFLAERPRPRGAAGDGVFRLLVTLGGSTAASMIPRLLDGLLDDGIEITIATGQSDANGETLREWAASAPHPPRVVAAAEDMPRLMNRADLAVSGAGTTAWELAYLGVPAVLLELADNQEPIGDALDRCGAAINLGPAIGCDYWQLSALVGALRHAPERLAEMSAAGRGLVDGRGALRVADAIIAARRCACCSAPAEVSA
jgi:UDP-2,4-diacetamido-2,4,6-trideoxy-beta-L-altropyranose hydrolase